MFHWSADLRKLFFYSCPLGLIAQNNKSKGSYEKSENRKKAICRICISFNVNGLLTTRVVEGGCLRSLEGSRSVRVAVGRKRRGDPGRQLVLSRCVFCRH